MQKVATRPHARQMPHGQAASFSIYGSILYKNRQALPVRDTSHGNDLHTASFIPYYYLYYETIARLSRGKPCPAEHFVQKNKNAQPGQQRRPGRVVIFIQPAPRSMVVAVLSSGIFQMMFFPGASSYFTVITSPTS